MSLANKVLREKFWLPSWCQGQRDVQVFKNDCPVYSQLLTEPLQKCGTLLKAGPPTTCEELGYSLKVKVNEGLNPQKYVVHIQLF